MIYLSPALLSVVPLHEAAALSPVNGDYVIMQKDNVNLQGLTGLQGLTITRYLNEVSVHLHKQLNLNFIFHLGCFDETSYLCKTLVDFNQ